MNPEKALATYYAGPYMRSAKAQAIIDAEIGKGCDGNILPNPVALEPIFHPITVTRDLMALKDRPWWIFESPPQQQDIFRYKVWLSPDQPFNWDCLELFIKQLSLVSHRVGLEITGNRKRFSIAAYCDKDCPLYAHTVGKPSV